MKRKLLWLLESPENFQTLLGMVVLFDKTSRYYMFSGYVTAALLDSHDKENKISVFSINTIERGYTFYHNREKLSDMLLNCIEFVGKTPEETFTIEK